MYRTISALNVQVWSNGKLKKVRGRPVPTAATTADANGVNSRTVSISLLITLPADSQVSPLLPTIDENADAEQIGSVTGKTEEEDGNGEGTEVETAAFRWFRFEEYAWRVYHDRCFLLKDPLARYRI